VETVFELRQKLKEAVGVEFLNTTPAADTFKRLVALVMELLPKGIEYKVLEDTLRHLAGMRLDERILDSMCWRVAGNVKRLKQRKVVPPWHIQKLPEWVPVQTTACRRERSSRGKFGARFQFRILAGTPAGLLAEKFWTTKFCRFISENLGFGKHNYNRPTPKSYSVPEQFVGLRLYVCVTPKLSGKEPGFDGIGFPGSCVTWNKVTINCRARTQPGFTCLLKQTAMTLACHTCPIGFLRCRAATHRQDWVKQYCSDCSREAYFNPEVQSDVCVDCTSRAAYRNT